MSWFCAARNSVFPDLAVPFHVVLRSEQDFAQSDV